MSEYIEALAELVALPARLEQQLAAAERVVAAERQRRERELDARTAQHREVLERLEATLQRAREEEIGTDPAGASAREAKLGRDPLDQAAQLVARLEQALEQALLTRESLRAEVEKLSVEAAERAGAERRRREQEELRRGEAWERARQGSIGLIAALGAALLGGALAASASAVALLVVAILLASGGAALALNVTSRLPAIAARRASGSTPLRPEAPPREARLGAAAYASTALATAGLGALITSDSSVMPAAITLLALGLAATALVWFLLPVRAP